MRICIVVPYDVSEEGGVKRHAVHLAEALRSAGDEVEVAGPSRHPLFDPNLQVFDGVVNIPANGADNHIALFTPPASVASYFRRRRFDVVHVHEPMVPLLPWYATWFAGHAARVATFHMFAEEEGVPSRAARGALSRLLYGSFDAATAVSKPAAEYAGRFWKRSLPVIPNGVPTALFHPPRRAASSGSETRDGARPKRLLFVGNWRDPRKGLRVLLEAFRTLRSQGLALELDVIGKGGPRAEPSIPGVTFHGVVESENDLARHYRECDVFVSPATGQESFGIVLLEAMSCARPIVCSDIRGYREVVDPNGSRLVPPDDAAALARGIAEIVNDPERRRMMGAINRRRAEEFEWTLLATRVRTVYLEALALRRGAPSRLSTAGVAPRPVKSGRAATDAASQNP
jgi:phosphatidylinositol alpha-mannosyltransferase